MWIRKTIGTITQLCIIILAILLVYEFSSKQIYDGRIDSLERNLNAKIDDNKKYLNDKITIQQDNVNRYIQLREDRAKLYSSRIDALYDLYKKDPTPIINANASLAQVVADTTTPKESLVDRNFSYLESKINNVAESSDNRVNKLESKVGILEQRVELIQQDKKSASKVVQNNIQTVNNAVQK